MARWLSIARTSDVRTVPELDLERYQGTWYELATLPSWFERGCTDTTATYELREDGLVRVVNRCRRGSVEGREASVTGRARRKDPAEPGKLQVSFFGPFWASYWVVDLDPDYRWAVVGTPDRRGLWLLSREPHVPDALYEDLVGRARAAGFDTARLVRTPQGERVGVGSAA